MRIRPAEVDDAAAVLEIERACAEAPHWSEGIWAQVFSQQSLYGFEAAIRSPQRQCFVAEQDDEVVGFVVLGILSSVAELESIAVRENARRRGVGCSLCHQAMLWAQTMGAESMELEVRSVSLAAVALYQSLGFVEEGRRKGYYREPVDDALLMRVPLTGNAAKV